MTMQVSDDGKAFIKRREACKLTPYRDGAGFWTVGFGHKMLDTDPHVAITQDEADALFDLDVLRRSDALNSAITTEINQWIFDALFSWQWNVGTQAVLNSTALTYINAEMFSDACVELLTWNKSGGQFTPGLLTRRAMEVLIFARGEYH